MSGWSQPLEEVGLCKELEVTNTLPGTEAGAWVRRGVGDFPNLCAVECHLSKLTDSIMASC